MYKYNKPTTTQLSVNNSYQGITIEKKVQRITSNKEPITDGAPLNFTERSEGVKAEYDPRTDRWELGVEAMDVVTKSHLTKREERHKAKMEAIKGGKDETKDETKGQSTDGTSPTGDSK